MQEDSLFDSDVGNISFGETQDQYKRQHNSTHTLPGPFMKSQMIQTLVH